MAFLISFQSYPEEELEEKWDIFEKFLKLFPGGNQQNDNYTPVLLREVLKKLEVTSVLAEVS